MSVVETEHRDAEWTAERRDRIRAALDGHPYRPPWWLRNNHLQTTVTTIVRRRRPLPFRRERLDTPDGDFLDLHHLDGGPDKPRAILLHGLEGCAESRYVCGMTRQLRARDWHVTVLEFRTCGGEMNRCERTYHIGETSDLDFVVRMLAAREPERRLYIGGVSLGGNVTLKWLGENGDGVPAQVRGGAGISCPFDLLISGPHMDRTFFGLYLRYFMPSLKRKALAKAEQFPGLLDIEQVKRARNFQEYDSWVTARLHGFEDAEDYWRRTSCGQFLPHIRRPALVLASADDPFNPGETLPRAAVKANPYLVDQFTEHGGHVGFLYGTPWAPRYWAEEQLARFFFAVDAEWGA